MTRATGYLSRSNEPGLNHQQCHCEVDVPVGDEIVCVHCLTQYILDCSQRSNVCIAWRQLDGLKYTYCMQHLHLTNLIRDCVFNGDSMHACTTSVQFRKYTEYIDIHV